MLIMVLPLDYIGNLKVKIWDGINFQELEGPIRGFHCHGRITTLWLGVEQPLFLETIFNVLIKIYPQVSLGKLSF